MDARPQRGIKIIVVTLCALALAAAQSRAGAVPQATGAGLARATPAQEAAFLAKRKAQLALAPSLKALAQKDFLAREAKLQIQQVDRQLQMTNALLSQAASGPSTLRQALQTRINGLAGLRNRLANQNTPSTNLTAEITAIYTPQLVGIKGLHGGGTCVAPSITGFGFSTVINGVTVGKVTSTSSGLPGDLITLSGSFGTTPGSVNFQVAPGVTEQGQIFDWENDFIVVYVPDYVELQPYTGSINVTTCTQSNSVTFTFNPGTDRYILISGPGTAVWAISGCEQGPTAGLGSQNLFGAIGTCYWAGDATDSPYECTAWEQLWGGIASGSKGDDLFFKNTQLKNGWVLDSAQLDILVYTGNGVNFQVQVGGNGTNSGGARVATQSPGSSSPFVDVHWWVDANNMTGYILYVIVKGPHGTLYY